MRIPLLFLILISFFIFGCTNANNKEPIEFLVVSGRNITNIEDNHFLLSYDKWKGGDISVFTNEKNEIILGDFVSNIKKTFENVYNYYRYDVNKNELFRIQKPQILGIYSFNPFTSTYLMFTNYLKLGEDILDYFEISNGAYCLNIEKNAYSADWIGYLGIFFKNKIERIYLSIDGKKITSFLGYPENYIFYDSDSKNIYFIGMVVQNKPGAENMIAKYNLKTKKTYKVIGSKTPLESFNSVMRLYHTNIIVFIGPKGLTFYIDDVPEK